MLCIQTKIILPLT